MGCHEGHLVPNHGYRSVTKVVGAVVVLIDDPLMISKGWRVEFGVTDRQEYGAQEPRLDIREFEESEDSITRTNIEILAGYLNRTTIAGFV